MSKTPRARGLGRGLDALFADQQPIMERTKTEEESSGTDPNSIRYLDINNIKPNRNQPRADFDKEKITELAESIKEHGIIQPLVVRQESAVGVLQERQGWKPCRASSASSLTKRTH